MYSTMPAPPPLCSEDEIVATWRTMGPPVVSICCATYNHALYIKDALQGFLAQKTTFPFEIIIRDDASTDGTTDIVREYARRYPNIIRLVVEAENQFKNGVRPVQVWPTLAKGEFVALCEGDDYWIASDKLEKQVELLRRYPQATMSVAYTVACNMTEEDTRCVNMSGETDKELQDFEDIKLRYFHTSSYLIRTKLLRDVLGNYLGRIEFGDTALRFMLADIGPFALLKEVVSVYRITGKGIWTSLSRPDQIAWEIRLAESFYQHFNPAHRRYFAGRLCRLYAWMLLHRKWSFNQKLWYENLFRFLNFALKLLKPV